jgi:formylglycine-generating enzyme required for sulfatase activity
VILTLESLHCAPEKRVAHEYGPADPAPQLTSQTAPRPASEQPAPPPCVPTTCHGKCGVNRDGCGHSLDCGTCAQPVPRCPLGMAALPGGSFTMGGLLDGDIYDAVGVRPFCMDITEVTVSAYGGCVAANGCSEPAPYLADDVNNTARACNWKRPGAIFHPVNCVDWSQASAYCTWASKRLPTEEEWEWAARDGQQGRTWPWGNEPPSGKLVNACGTECVTWVKANFGQDWKAMYLTDDGWPTTAPVGSFPRGRTAQGLQDMAGNVWEWTASNGSLWGQWGKVYRGGSWFTDRASNLRAAARMSEAATFRSYDLGFRCAR